MKRSHYMLLLLLALGLGTASFFIHQSDYPLTYDEGDYWVAVQNGVWTNWTDADDIPILEFARMGIDAVGDPGSRARLSDYIRSSGSTMFYRHYHPALAYYPAAALRPFVGALPLQWQLRLSNLFWLFAWIAVLALLGWSYAEARSPVFIILPASSAWAMAVVGFNMHLPFGLLASLFFLNWYLYETHRRTAFKRLAQFFLAASFATVAYGMFLLFFIVVWGAITFWKSGEKTRFLRDAAISAGWVLLFLLLLWPAGVLGLGLLKTWTFVMYIALFRLGAEPVAFAGWWTLLVEKWNANPLELLVLIGLLGTVLFRWRLLFRRGSLFVAAGFVLTLLYLQMNPTLVYRWYLFPASAVAFVFFGFVFERKGEGKGENENENENEYEYENENEYVNEGKDEYVHVHEYENEGGGGQSSVKALMFAGIGVVLFVAAWVLVPEPDYSALKHLHTIVDAAKPSIMTIPRSVLPQLKPYHPDAEIISYHDVAYPEMSLPDSIPVWRARGFVLIPKGIDFGDIKPDGETGAYWYFHH